MIVRNIIEIDEAIEAGERVLDRVDEALDYLDSARNWGIFDMFSKHSLVSSLIKHKKLDNAEEVMYELRDEIKRFNNELEDVRLPELPNIQMGDFAKFADIFFDNTFVDIFALSHISESKRKLEDLGASVQDIIDELRRVREEY